uniref:Uncharacterized protein n=1 Tax=Anguilla anguilla TaxID=7936 RepID=A0A0E9VTX8_ANGAN
MLREIPTADPRSLPAIPFPSTTYI